MSKARHPGFLINPIKISGYSPALSLSIKNIWNR